MPYDISAGQILAQPVSAFFQGRALKLSQDAQTERMALANAENTRQQESHDTQQKQAQIQFGEVQAKKVYAASQQVLASDNPKALVEQQFPEFIKDFQAHGQDWSTVDDNTVKQLAQGVGAHAAAELGITPVKGDEFTLKPGEKRFQGTKEIASGGPEDKSTSEQRDYAAAQAQGYKGSFLDYQIQLKKSGATTISLGDRGLSAPPTGYARPDPAKPGLVIEPGGPADPANKPKPLPSEADKKAAVMFGSMVDAETQLQSLKGADTSNVTQSALGGNSVTKLLQSDDYRKYEAAGLRWAANLLYLKSGATANPDEIRSTWKQFFPQPGDGEDVKAQKTAARNQEMHTVAKTYNFDPAQIPGTGGHQKITSDAEHAQLPSGSTYIAPDGSTRKKR